MGMYAAAESKQGVPVYVHCQVATLPCKLHRGLLQKNSLQLHSVSYIAEMQIRGVSYTANTEKIYVKIRDSSQIGQHPSPVFLNQTFPCYDFHDDLIRWNTLFKSKKICLTILYFCVVSCIKAA